MQAPDGTQIYYDDGTQANNLDNGPFVLDQTGTYILFAEGPDANTPTYSFQLWEVPPTPKQNSLALGGAANGDTEIPGWTEDWVIGIDSSNVGSIGYIDFASISDGTLNIRLFDPTGAQIDFWGPESVNALDRGPFIFDQLGDYRINVDPFDARVITYHFTLADLPQPAQVNQNFNERMFGEIEQPGVWDEWFFDANVGDEIYLDFHTTNGVWLEYIFYNPDGSPVIAGSNSSGLDRGPFTLTQDGQYTFFVRGVGSNTMQY